MTQAQPVTTTPPVVYFTFPEDMPLDRIRRRMDKEIDLARFGARKDNVTVIIRRAVPTHDVEDSPYRELLEITPEGDVREIDVPPLRVSIAARLTELDLLHRTGQMNVRAGLGHVRMAEVAKIAADYVSAENEWKADCEAKQQTKRSRKWNKKRHRAPQRVAA